MTVTHLKVKIYKEVFKRIFFDFQHYFQTVKSSRLKINGAYVSFINYHLNGLNNNKKSVSKPLILSLNLLGDHTKILLTFIVTGSYKVLR